MLILMNFGNILRLSSLQLSLSMSSAHFKMLCYLLPFSLSEFVALENFFLKFFSFSFLKSFFKNHFNPMEGENSIKTQELTGSEKE